MKYVIIIPDGAADHPLDELGGQTPFEVAKKPHTDRLSLEGRQGTVATTPPGASCGSDVCTMSLLGYDPMQYHRGRAPLEAAALRLKIEPSDWIFRVNMVTVIEGRMQDHSAGHLTSQESQRLLSDLAKQLDLPGVTLYPGVSYRNIMIDASASGGGGDERDWSKLVTTPPHDILNQPIRKHLPTGGKHAGVLREMIQASAALFDQHEVNQTRRELGELPATHVWPWGQGQRPVMPGFASRFGLKGAMITAVDLLAGLSLLIGWDRLDVPGQTSYHDTDYAQAGQHGIAALDRYDVVCVHVESPDEASHAADAITKVAAIEAIDRHIVGPIHAALRTRDKAYRILYLPDHYTSASSRLHDPTPVPFVICGHQVHSVLKQPFSERNANQSDLHIQVGHDLMEYFLFGGLS